MTDEPSYDPPHDHLHDSPHDSLHDLGDRELRALLGEIDPASPLPAAESAAVTRLMEDAMSEMPTEMSELSETRDDPLRRRSRLTWLVAAAAAAVIVGGAVFAVVGNGDESPVTATDAPGVVTGTGDGDGTPADAGAPSTTELTVTQDAPTAKCLAPAAAPQVVAAQTLVVDATVESISGGVVTLAPTRFYAGEETDLVTVAQPSGDMEVLLTGVDFEEGGRYLVAATDGRVTLCGFSAPYSEELAAVYDEAFPG